MRFEEGVDMVFNQITDQSYEICILILTYLFHL